MKMRLGEFNPRAFKRLHDAAERDRKKLARKMGVHESEVVNDHVEDYCGAIVDGEVTVREFSIRGVFESTIENGTQVANSWRKSKPGNPTGIWNAGIRESITSGAFGQINQAFMYRAVLEAYAKPELIASQLVEVVPSDKKFERVRGVTELGDNNEVVGEGENYPYASLSEDWVETQETEKRGVIVPITKEAIFFDETGLVMQRAQQVAWWLAVNYEKRSLDTVLGIVDRYNRRSRNVQATYGNNSGNHDWDNLQVNPLVDYESIEAADLLFEDMVDPNTGEPIMIGARQMLVPGALYQTALSIIGATEIDRRTQGTTDVGFAAGRKYANPYRGMPAPITSPYVKARASTSTSWWYGDFKRCFKYYENWAPQAVTAPTNNEDEFERDIVYKNKISEMGQHAVVEPRYVQQNDAS